MMQPSTRPALRQPTPFGRILKQWREGRRTSQLDLALTSGVSQRHVSFLESGRAWPSRDMVLQLATALDVPLREQNALLLAAGFAPAFRESDLSAPELHQVNQALGFMLGQQEPYPALVVDRHWNLLRSNAAAQTLIAFLLDLPGNADVPAPAQPVNLMRLVFDPQGVRPCVENWEEVAFYLLRRMHAEEEIMEPGRLEDQPLFRELLSFPDVPRIWKAPRIDEWRPPILTVRFRKGDVSLGLFTTITTLGTPHDVTLQEIRVECFFPADAATAAQFRAWAEAAADRESR